MTLRNAIKVEEFAMFVLAAGGFIYFGGSWTEFFLLILLPDLGMLGYLIDTRIGANTYNSTHHKGIAITLFIIGCLVTANALTFAGIIIFAHASIDRVLGYGLKYKDSFKNTHLGKLK